MRGRSLVLASILGLSGACHKPCPPPPPKAPPTVLDAGAPAARVFPRLKALSGPWLAGETSIIFEVLGKGTAVAQRSGFFVVWYVDGEALAGSLFPDDGYHAKLRSTRISDTEELVIEMATVETGNVAPDAPLARSMTMTISPKDDRITQRWVFGTGPDSNTPFELVMTRAPAAAPIE
jgi:hypothetical protein